VGPRVQGMLWGLGFGVGGPGCRFGIWVLGPSGETLGVRACVEVPKITAGAGGFREITLDDSGSKGL